MITKIDAKALALGFPQRRGAWRVLATNLIPPLGVLVLGWSTASIVASYVADTLFTVCAITFVLANHVVAETAAPTSRVSRVASVLGAWVVVTPILSMFVLVPATFIGGPALAGGGLDALFAGEPSFVAGLAAMACLHAAAAWRWLRREDRRGVRDEVREAFSLVIFKSFAFALVGAHVGAVLLWLGAIGQAIFVLALAAILTIAEVYRSEVLRAMNVTRAWHAQCEGEAGGSARAGTPRRSGDAARHAEAKRRAAAERKAAKRAKPRSQP